VGADSWKIHAGINNVGSYQVSGIPFATASVDAMAASGTVVRFPYVTKWIKIETGVNADLRVGFSRHGICGAASNYFVLQGNPTGNDSGQLDIKVSEIWLSGSADCSIMAGLTGILPQRCQGIAGPSWSGSIGVDSHDMP
jgi:hypothetical protein|tara:strand:- start:3840 stop:4259 length:420 start_codon:yes stop_codon:yes gene_type:complete